MTKSATPFGSLTGARLTAQQAGSVEALRLQTEQIEQQRQLAMAGLAANTAKTAATAAPSSLAANSDASADG
jgi:hypothetical protein